MDMGVRSSRRGFLLVVLHSASEKRHYRPGSTETESAFQKFYRRPAVSAPRHSHRFNCRYRPHFLGVEYAVAGRAFD